MAKLDIQYDILNDAPATASPVEANFNRLEQHINQEVIERGGTVAMVAQLQLAGDPVTPLAAVPKQYVDAILPIGIITMFGGVAAPPGGKWALCNGAELESALYPELYAVIGAAYSLAGTPAGRFNLPNLTDRFGIGAGSVASLGKTGGSKDSVVPTHSHTIDHAHPTGTSENDFGQPHQHDGVDHVHSLNNVTAGASARHTHGNEIAGGMYMTYNVGGTVKVASGTQIPFLGPLATGVDSPDHTHWLTGATGPADRNLRTSSQTALHTHRFTTPAFSGSTAVEGVAVTDTNLPPYVAVTYIMRIQ